jgi:uncharacterized protein YqeY
MKEHDNQTRDVLRSLVSDIKNQTINAGKDITEDAVLKCLQKSVKQHNDSINQFNDAGRTELAEKELAERMILERYLPSMKSEDEIKDIINELIKTIEPIKRNMGIIMKNLNDPSIDKKIASKYLNQILK